MHVNEKKVKRDSKVVKLYIHIYTKNYILYNYIYHIIPHDI